MTSFISVAYPGEKLQVYEAIARGMVENLEIKE